MVHAMMSRRENGRVHANSLRSFPKPTKSFAIGVNLVPLAFTTRTYELRVVYGRVRKIYDVLYVGTYIMCSVRIEVASVALSLASSACSWTVTEIPPSLVLSFLN